MKLIREIDILHDKKIVIILNVLALLLVIPFLYLFGWIALGLETAFGIPLVEEVVNPSAIWIVLICCFVLLVIHEGIHGIFFKVFQPKNKVKFGFKLKSLMAYATSPGSIYSRGQMLVIGLAPFVVISLALSILMALRVISPAFFVFLAAIHAAGCIGDFYYAYLLLFPYGKMEIRVEDTLSGLRIYQV